MEKKRKIDSECRKFEDQWNIQYFVIESSNKALCLICNESIAVLKEYNMKRHYETKHSQNYSKNTGIVRTEIFEALKRGLKSQQSLFTKVKTEQEAATRASFRVALEIAKRGKPFTDGEMIKECIIAVVEEMCPEKVNLLKTVSMSANTVARKVENIAENISSQLFDKNGHVEWFSLALDESTDVSDTAQVLIYIRGVDKSYEVHEELLDMYSIHGTTTGTDIFKGVEMAINKKNLRWKNLKCITTDGGKNMSGKDKGVVALVMEKKRKIDSECRKFEDQWNIQYFVIESSNKALCLICNESIAVLKEYNMKRHYETKHSQNYSKNTGIVRTEIFEALKRGLKSQQSLFTKVKTEQEAATRASFRVALEIAKRGKPFTDGEMIKECIIAVVEEMCPEKVNLLKTVSMSANTVARKVENIAENISSQLFDKNGHVEWFSLALDESTDVSDTAQVLIYIRGVDKSYEVHEELLDMYSIHGTTTGTDIFKGVEMAINKKNLRWKNLK
ncbi:EPM2AIP1, partial [Cordylochernes scorpioides]